MKEETTSPAPSVNKVDSVLRTTTARLGVLFNNCSSRTRKFLALCFGLFFASICVLLIFQALTTETSHPLHLDSITKPLTIPMEPIQPAQDTTSLIPLGKMKGEINGEFEAFYLALDKDGSIYMNHNLGYRQDAYKKSNDWKLITREELKAYEKELHFLPIRSKGLRR